MAVYIKGDPVANATSYKLLEKKGSDYTNLAEASEINFEVSALGLPGGEHTLVVKASASGYADSDYSNEVVYNAIAEYTSFKGSADFKNTLCIKRVSSTASWYGTTETTAKSTDYLEVKSTDSVWIQYAYNKNNLHAVGGFYDSNKTLIAALYNESFANVGTNASGSGTAAFATPDETDRVAIADIEAATGKTVKYVRFTAWTASSGGVENTEARIYH